MPTIDVNKKEFLKHLKSSGLTMEKALLLIKGEIKGEDELFLKIDIADTNRPDLFTLEGIARQLLSFSQKKHFTSDFLHKQPGYKLEILPSVEKVRPFAGAFLAHGCTLNEDGLDSLIRIQEKLGDTIGRRRRKVGIGIYDATTIKFPVRYGAFSPESHQFTPLGSETEMTLEEILKRHPKGVEYGNTLLGAAKYPLFIDAEDKILSFPPIINSKRTGEVKVGMDYLFIEATGTEQKAVILSLNVLAAALSFRGAMIERIEASYPYQTPVGRSQPVPAQLMSKPLMLRVAEAKKMLGIEIDAEEISDALLRFGYEFEKSGDTFKILAPYYRSDVMHQYDVIEDLALARGYDNFSPLSLSDFTIGNILPEEEAADRVGNIFVGMGFQEIISNMLVNTSFSSHCMLEKEYPYVEVENVMSESYSGVRHWLIPSLLKVEMESSSTPYPHRIFEVGEVVIRETRGKSNHDSIRTGLSNGVNEEIHIAALLSGPGITFNDAHRALRSLMEELSIPYELREINHNSFIKGRCGAIEIAGSKKGIIGEIFPEVLSRWSIKMPVSVFEITQPPALLKRHRGTEAQRHRGTEAQRNKS
ncbi:MAG: Phenylalanine--tRNA ligase beta subunit [Syntrophomonadaceae bacterium]|nr:Phenylalanine--tRNA ligase beta subunit [Bacillota bacterium]